MTFTSKLAERGFGTGTITPCTPAWRAPGLRFAAAMIVLSLVLISPHATAASLEQDSSPATDIPAEERESSASDPELPEYRADELLRNFSAPEFTGSIDGSSAIPAITDEPATDQESLFGE